MKFSCQACGSTAVPVTDCVSLQDPQYMQQALTNALLMDAAVGSLQNSKSIYAASKLAHFDRIKMEGVGTGFLLLLSVWKFRTPQFIRDSQEVVLRV